MLSPAQESDQRFQITSYYWRQGFMLFAPSFVLDRSDRPYRRLSATFMLALKKPFVLETGSGELIEASAVLIAPKVLRRRISAIDSDIVIIDISVVTPEYRALKPLLDKNPVQALSASLFKNIQLDFKCAHRGEFPAQALRELLHCIISSAGGQISRAPALDPRITEVLDLVDKKPLTAVTLSWLAENVHLSPSRLRHLFQEQCGSSLTHYLRWNAVWKGVWMWSRGEPLAKVAEAVGFHDLAHLNRAFNEVFGLNPSAFFHSDRINLIRCDWA